MLQQNIYNGNRAIYDYLSFSEKRQGKRLLMMLGHLKI